METVKDIVFGEMKYDHSWYKRENISLWGIETELKIVAFAYSEQGINDQQRSNYKYFKDNLDDISLKSYEAVKQYIEKYRNEINMSLPESSKSYDIKKLVVPRIILFKKDGVCGILCDCIWDEENGLAIQFKPAIDVGPQDIIL